MGNERRFRVVMSKGLDALKRIKSRYNDRVCIDILEDFDLVEKEIKALEIIKKKDIHKTMLSLTQSADEYNHFIDDVDENLQLTQKEYDLLKKVLL